MAMKDWKKISTDRNEYGEQTAWKKGDIYILVIGDGKNFWRVDYSSPSIGKTLETFNSKSKAMKYAMSYMRKH